MYQNEYKNYTYLKVIGVFDLIFAVIMFSIALYNLNNINDAVFFDDNVKVGSNLLMILACVSFAFGPATILAGVYKENESRNLSIYLSRQADSQNFSTTPVPYKICGYCGHTNENTYTYCENCHRAFDNKTRVVHRIPNIWYCPSCGTKNQSYVGTCGCGQQKPKI